MAIVIERVADVGYEEDFAKYSQMKYELREKLEAEKNEKIALIEAELEKTFAEQSEKLTQLIELTSHEVEVEVEDVADDVTESVGE